MNTLGIIEAGFPTSASEEMLDTMSLDEYLVENKEATYMIKVSGDSMANSGIFRGDTLIVERGKTPRPQDIVIIETDGSYKMKYVKDLALECRIEAVVTVVIRKY